MQGTAESERLQDSLLVTFKGDIGDGLCESTLEGVCADVCANPSSVVIDLTETTYMDYTAFDALMNLWGELRVADKRLALVAASDDVRRHLDALGLSDALYCFDSVENALGRDSADTRLIRKKPSRRKPSDGRVTSVTKVRTRSEMEARAKTRTDVKRPDA